MEHMLKIGLHVPVNTEDAPGNSLGRVFVISTVRAIV